MAWNLLEKTTFWIEGIDLENIDLKSLANRVSRVFDMNEGEIMVVDVRKNLVVFDILRNDVLPEQVVGKKEKLISELRLMEGIRLSESPQVHSEGILGLIAADEGEIKDILDRTNNISNEIANKIQRRIIIFASGNELLSGKIVDTNSPYLKEIFEEDGFDVKYGGILPDDPETIASYLEDAMNEGFGYIILTGGTGAEDKDYTASAIDKVTKDKVQAYILKFSPGSNYASHYHHKGDGVKITVGICGITKIIGLPGPHDEVKMIAKNLLHGIKNNVNANDLAQLCAEPLRKKWGMVFQKNTEGGV